MPDWAALSPAHSLATPAMTAGHSLVHPAGRRPSPDSRLVWQRREAIRPSGSPYRVPEVSMGNEGHPIDRKGLQSRLIYRDTTSHL